ncbi:MAG: DEAD/DEAH box helicase [Hydrogenophaga sp.]|nr:DEAD/DEAH box helicase [Hydrogenophaga sp.]
MSDFEVRGETATDTLSNTSVEQMLDTSTAAFDVVAEAAAEPNGFELLGLAPELVRAVADLGYVQPTAVQNAVVPDAMNPGLAGGRYTDLMVSSQTGSGKTAAFLLPVLHTLLQQQADAEAAERAEFDRLTAEAAARGEAAPKRPKRKSPLDPRHFKAATPGALIVCPTRELAQQVAHDAIELVAHCRGLRVANVVGGMPYQLQIAKLQNADLVVATPGRLLDLQRSQQIKLDKVQFLVVDEADRMLDLGFSDDLAEFNQLTRDRRQTMMFSATFAPRIQQLAMRVMHDGGKHVKRVQIDSPQEKHANIKQVLFWADNAQHKRALLDHWLRDATINQANVFASTQIECDGLAEDLQQAGFDAVALHGALSQGLRNRRLMALRDGRVQILVATDVAARGIDVPTITHVFNFGLPMKAEDYTHRIGRTGRAGRDGLAVTFAEFRDRRRIGDIEAYSQQRFKAEVIPGMEPKERAPAPARAERGRPGGDRGSRFGGRPEGRGFGGGFGRADKGRFEGGRPEGRFEGARPEGRPEGRFDNRPAGRFEGRPEGRPDNRSDNRFDPRGAAPSPFERGARPAERSFDRNDRGQDRFADRAAPRFEDRARTGAPRHAPGAHRGAERTGAPAGNGGFGGRPQARRAPR